MLYRRCSAFLLLLFSLSATANELTKPLDQVIKAHQKMLVLLDSAEEMDPLDPHIFAARNFYVRKQHLQEHIITAAEQENLNSQSKHLLTSTQNFIDYYRNNKKLAKADRLALVNLADEFLLLEQERNVPSQGLTLLRRINADISLQGNYFRKEYRQSINKLGRTRGSREEWQLYLDTLKKQFPVKHLLSEIEVAPELYQEKSRSNQLAINKQDQLTTSLAPVIWGNGLPEKTVVLTFDDGPHRRRTDNILDILKTYNVNAYFFAVGRNLGKTGKETTINKRNKAVIRRITSEGHILANHSFSHKILTKLNKLEKTIELDKTNQLIKVATGFDNTLFRPPYGSKNPELESIAKEQGLSSIMWNIDSMDWADPVPESIVQRVMKRLEKKKRGILLFHDIHKQTVAALPLLLEKLIKEGYRVVTLDGSPFTLGESGLPKLPEPEEPELYSNSWAVVIGANKYQHWPKLDYAVSDARSLAQKLQENFGFKKENIIELYDEQATRRQIVETLGYTLADPNIVGKNDRVFVFYAGHGATRQLPNGKNLGYLIPVDAELEKFQTQGISMSMLNDFSDLIPAKHIYFVMDSCYSGLALTRAGAGSSQSYNYLEHITNRQARQIITAGGADQEVADGGPEGHSIFTWTLLQALDGKADTDNNGYITASEIGTYVAPVVASYAPQTPAFGNLVGNQGGDFVFKLNKNSLDRIKQQERESKQQQQQVLTQNQNNLLTNVDRKLELAKTRSDKQKPLPARIVSSKDNKRVQTANRADAEALKLFNEGKLELAEKKWAEAVRLNPYNINIVNNYGYVLDKLNRNDEALIWYYRTIELNPRRTPIYLNLGDIMMKMGKPELAIPYYQRYLHLYPSYEKADELKAVIKSLESGE